MEKNMSVTIAGDVLCDIVSGFLQGIGVHCYIDGIDAAPGGATGLSILLNRITGLPIGMLTIWINLPLMVASWILLGRSRTVKQSRQFDLQCDHRSGSDTIFAGIYREPVYGMHYWRCLGWDRDGNRFYEWIYNGRK